MIQVVMIIRKEELNCMFAEDELRDAIAILIVQIKKIYRMQCL